MLVDCTFNIESISICDGGASIHVTKVALDHIEVAVHEADSSGVPDTKQPESSWHPVSGATCQLELVIFGSGLLEDGNLNTFCNARTWVL